MLNVLDMFFKYIWSRPLKRENVVVVSTAFEKFIKDALRIGHKSSDILQAENLSLRVRNLIYY